MLGVFLFVGGFSAPAHGLCGNVGRLPSQSRLPPCQLPQRGSQVGAQPEICRKPSLASPLGGRWCPVGTVQRSVSAAASVGDGRSPLGCITRAGRRECTRVSEDGEGKVPAAPSHGLCGSAGGLPSQSRLRRASSPKGRAKSRLPLWGRCPPREGGEGTPLARRPAFGKPPSWCATGRERRGKAPVSLASLYALRAYKGKGKVETFL